MSQTVRLLPLESCDGPANMAADEVMLEAAAAGIASFRFYTWRVPTLSLGYFQPEAVRHTDFRLQTLPYVRRPSGGATLVHDQELTYALALPADARWQPRGQSWICRMHTIIAAALSAIDITAKPVTFGKAKKFGDTLCFLHHTAGDLIVEGHKIVGSAQRKQRGALLQHGAILLAQSASTPNLPGIHELCVRTIIASDLSCNILADLERETAWKFSREEWTDNEIARIAELVQQKYAQDWWNRKR